MDLEKTIKEINSKYTNINVKAISPGEKPGSFVMQIRPSVAYLESQSNSKIPLEFRDKQLASITTYKDILSRQSLDLARRDFDRGDPHNLYKIINEYYWNKDVFGSFIDVLVSFAASGFYNDCKDDEIKNFYDHWCYDIKIRKVLDQIFQEYFKTGFVRTYRVFGSYVPDVSPLPPLKKKAKSKGQIPIAYQVLNPLSIKIVGSLFLNQTRVSMPIDENMKMLFEKPDFNLTDEEKILLKNLSPDVKKAIKDGNDIVFDPLYIGAIDYMKMDYDRYATPLGLRAFDALDYKSALRNADYSAVDGVARVILKVTVGNDEYPVSDPNQLEAVASLFTSAQDSYAVVWNHLLQIERIESQNTDKIFGKSKFEQVNADISGSFGVVRALVDGIVEGDTSSEALKLGVKSVVSKLNYARRDVADWLEGEYKYIAKTNKFEVYPSVRFDDMELKDEIQMMTLLQQLADRRIISYKTIQEKLDFDPSYELEQMGKEKPLVIDGTIGLYGSPYQKGGGGGLSVVPDNVQPTQKAPKGAPSEGRPKNQPAPKTPAPATPDGEVDYKTKVKPKRQRKAATIEDINKAIGKMTAEDLEKLESIIAKTKEIKKKEEDS